MSIIAAAVATLTAMGRTVAAGPTLAGFGRFFRPGGRPRRLPLPAARVTGAASTDGLVAIRSAGMAQGIP
jgi:hypothetical protein